MRAPFSLNPLMSREIRARWRDRRSFSLVFALATGLSLLFVWLYRSQSELVVSHPAGAQWAILGHQLFRSLTWIQTVAWLLLAPSLTSSSIAYERERGWFDALLLSPLLPRQIALGKWASALLFAALLYGTTLPFWGLTLLLGGVSLTEFWIALGLHLLCAAFGAAVGLAASAWSLRAHVALRSAYGLILLWLASSATLQAVAGEGPFARLASQLFSVSSSPIFYLWWGHTNPISLALELGSDAPELPFRLCFGFLSGATFFFLWIATHYSRRPLEEAPFISLRRTVKTKAGTVQATHGQIPLVTRLKFANPVLDREVRAKFRMRQPPVAVIIAEAMLGALVAYFYLRTLYTALFTPPLRSLVWWGLVFTGLIVTMMATAVMGGNGFSRERESGTWEGVRLSLLRPHEILSGKVGASLLTCALFSLPVWPLLLPCIAWNGGSGNNGIGIVAPVQALACLLVWAATAWSYTCIGLWMGRRHSRSARASGQTMGALAGFLIVFPMLAFGTDSEAFIYLLSTVHPIIALSMSLSHDGVPYIFATGLPYFTFHSFLGLFLYNRLHKAMNSDGEFNMESS